MTGVLLYCHKPEVHKDKDKDKDREEARGKRQEVRTFGCRQGLEDVLNLITELRGN